MSALRKVTMNLTERDVKNTERLTEKLQARSKAEAVSAALGITIFLSDMLQGGKELIIRNAMVKLKR